MRSNTVFVESRYFAEREKGNKVSSRVVFYRDEGNVRSTAEPRVVLGRQSPFILSGDNINKNIYCKLLGIKQKT